jgi:chorismate-pyruvate lyase
MTYLRRINGWPLTDTGVSAESALDFPRRVRNRRVVAACGIALIGSLTARSDVFAPAGTPIWPDTFVSRVEALALLQTFNAELLTHDSATLTLEHWCDVHRLASPPRIVAERVPNVDKPPSADQRRELGVGPTETVRYRRVRLLCGSVVLSEADNWYVPARLTAEMNELLDTTDVPFGKAVQGLDFQRRTLSSTLLWLPLPEGWEMMATPGGDGAAALGVPPMLLEHRAVLSLPNGTPFSEVVETYTNHILGFPAPRP